VIRKADSGVAFGYAVTSCSVISTERSEIFLNPGNPGSHKNERSCHHSGDAAEDSQQLRAMAGRLLISSQTRCHSPQGEVGPGNGTLLHRTAAGFTSTGIPDDFAVLCQLIAPCRRCPHRYAGGLSLLRSGSIRFLSIRSRFSHSVACIASLAGRLRCAPAPSRGRSPCLWWWFRFTERKTRGVLTFRLSLLICPGDGCRHEKWNVPRP
jgi:hypothetical protein